MDINYQADTLAQKIRHLIITAHGRRPDQATIEEFYFAFVSALREEIMINWTATLETFRSKKVRHMNYLSMEYLPGRLLGNNVTNIGATELVKAVLVKVNRTYADLMVCENDAGLGNGGLGRLASCFMDSLATLHYPARAYGLRYQYGIFEQEIWNGLQVERPDGWLLNANPWEGRRDAFAATVHFRGRPVHVVNQYGDDVFLLEDFEEVRALAYDTPVIGYSPTSEFTVLTLRLWSTKESPRNFELQRFNAGFLDQAAENISLTDVLYPNDQSEAGKRMRLKQEFLLVSASLKDICRRHMIVHGTMSNFGDKVRIQINDTHPALAIAELMRILTKNYDFSWRAAWEVTQGCCSYTNHTILREALEEWNQGRMSELLPRQLLIIQKLNLEFCNAIREKFPNDEERIRRLSIIENGQVRMANLAIYGSHKVNGVAELHTEILKKEIFADFYQIYPEKFVNVTNGVTQRRWLYHCNPKLAAFITKRIGSGWIDHFTEIEKLAAFASDPSSQQEFWEIKRSNKQDLVEFLNKENPVRDALGHVVAHSGGMDVKAIFDIHIKRFHEYKRQWLNALHLIMLFQEILDGKERMPRLSIFGGKAAPGYHRAKEIIDLICCIARIVNRHPAAQGKLHVAFIENYNVSKAELLIPAADLSEQISTAGWEASGTGNMKFAINGALTIGTEDGANIEMRQAVGDQWWPFRFGGTAEENKSRSRNSGRDIYQNDPVIRRVLDSLKDGTFAETDAERATFTHLYQMLLDEDRFLLLSDFHSYVAAQRKAEDLYRHATLWAETAIHNIAGMGRFSTDESIRNYAKLIWEIEPCPPDSAIMATVREEYSAHDRCRIVNK